MEGIQVIAIFERHAKSDPTVYHESACILGRKDCMLPMMMDSQFAERTVFLVCEQDWRMFAGFPEILDTVQAADPANNPATTPQEAHAAPSREKEEEEVFEMKVVPMPSAGRARPNRFLMDIVAAVNAAQL